MNPPHSRRRRRGTGPLVLAAAFLAGAAGVSGTAALWSADGGTPLGAIVAGDLDIELVGPTQWHETSPDVPGTPRWIDATEFLARPGDTLAAHQRFTTELSGASMRGLLGVTWERPPALPPGAVATYTVRDDADTEVVADVPLGTASRLPALDTDSGGRSDDYTLEVTITFPDAADRTGPDAAAQVAELGTVVLTLEQVRPGEGATP